MSDVTFVRFVDEQRAQVRWLFSPEASQNADALGEKVLFNSAVHAIELVLIGFFAERTQARFQPPLWQDLIAVGLHYRRLLEQAPCAEYLVSYWLEQETNIDSALALVQSAIRIAKAPAPVQYRSGLLSATSLESQGAMIATSASPERITFSELKQAWTTLENQIDSERAQALEC